VSLQQRPVIQERAFFSIADIVVLLVLVGSIAGIVSVAEQWRADYSPVTYIDLSARALPRYVILSAARGMVAYALSLFVALAVGYWTAKSKRAEAIVLPAVDILQTIPVLGFLPGLVLGLVALFPNTNLGLELAAVIMIFTSQVWNLIFSFYSSVKSVPHDLTEAATLMGLTRWQKFVKLELPYGAVPLSWNSLLSVAGGWFFLTICEAFTLGDRQFRLPGIGSYMAVAIAQGNARAMFMGVAAMVLLIVTMDFVIWRPLLAWVQRFRFESSTELGTSEPLMNIWMRESAILRWMKTRYYQYYSEYRGRVARETVSQNELPRSIAKVSTWLASNSKKLTEWRKSPPVARAIEALVLCVGVIVLIYGLWKLIEVWMRLPGKIWLFLLRDTFWSLLRVLMAVALGTFWAVPVGIWIGTSPRRIQIAQPIIQVLASFPAPMLYPLALSMMFALNISFDFGSMFLIMLGVQWYILFNVLAGAMRIPQELRYALHLMNAPRTELWRRLYLPSIFPTLVTGWIVAAGGGWNASIVAEYMFYDNKHYRTGGLGATISEAAAQADFPLLAASLSLMVLVVLVFNRLVWERVYRIAQTRYRLDY
jgi:NitT/TauT family transport system permease protein